MAKTVKKDNALTPEEKLESMLVPDIEQPYKIPKNWCWGYLTKSFAECKDAFRKPVNATERSKHEGNIPYYGATGQVGWIDDYLTDEELILLGEDGAPFLDLIKDKAYIITGKAWINNHAHILKSFFGHVGNKYLLHYLNIFDYTGYVNGTTRLKLTQASMDTMPIPIAPLTEQQRIVDRIESLFAKLDEAKEKAQAVIDGYENRKAAILHKAFTGELTAEWRKETGMSVQAWKLFKYGDLGVSKLGKMLDKEKNIGRPVPYLRNINVRWFGFDLTDISTMLATDEEIENLQVRDGDLFICEGGEPGRCAIWNGGNRDLIFQKALHRFRPNEKVKSEYLCYYLFYLSLRGSLEKHFTGTTIKHLTGRSLAEIQIILPTISEQEQIVFTLSKLFSLEQQAKETAEQVIDQIDIMKKSILSRAFRGELGTNDPKDESAVELLKKVLEVEPTPQPRRKGVFLPKDLAVKLKTELERKIVKLFIQRETDTLTIQELISVSSKTFEVLETLRDLESRQIIKKAKDNNIVYTLMR